jgi:cytoskeletal protein CcmA (bactofilin family)
MAFAVADRVRETTTTTGTGTLNLDGAVSGFRTFVSGIGDGNVTYYAIVHRTSAEFEIGIGTVTDASTDTLSRTTVLSSSNSNSAVTFSAGTKDVFCTQPASKAVFEDNNADVTLPDDLILGSDSAVLKFGADSDTTLTHTDGTGLTLNSTNKLTFGDAASFVQQSSNGVLRIDGEATIDLNASTAVTVSNDLKLDSDSAVLGFGADNDITITHAADTGLTVNGTFTATGFIIGSANINEAELETIDGVTAGTVAASKAVVVDSNKDIGSFRNVTLTGELDAATLDISGDADIDGTTNLDNTDIDGTLVVDGSNISLDSTSTLNIDNSNTSNGITIGTATSGVPISIGHTTSEVTVNDNLTVTGDLTVSGTTTTVNSTTVNLNDHNLVLDSGNTTSAVVNGAGLTIEGGSGDDATFSYNTTGPKFELKLGSSHEDLQVDQLIAASLDISGDVDVDGTLETDALSINGTAVTSTAAELNILDGVTSTAAELNLVDGITAGTVSASLAVIVDSNKDITGFRNVTLTGELDAATLDISGDADIDGTLEADAITIGGTAINTVIAGVTVTNATNAAHVSVADNESTNEENLITFIEDTSATGNVGLESDGDFTYNPSTGTVTATIFKGNIDAVDGDFDGTLEADAITVGGTALNTVIAGVTVANATTAAVATTVTISDNESTNEDNAVVFTSGGDVDGGNIGLESDGDLTYNPSTGRLTATQLAGTLQTAAQANVTSLGTLTTLTVDNVIINGTTIGHTDDTDLMTVADGVLTVAGEISVTTLDIGGTNVTSTAAELNILDGVTSTAAELNILDGVTSTATELNILDGVTATTAELNLLDGGTSVGSSITLADSDGIVTNDGGTMKTIPASDIKTYVGISAGALAITNLDIDGGTDIGADLVDADEIIVDDGGGGTNRRSDLTRVKKYIFSAVSGDATASDTGALTIANTSVETAMIAADAITEAKIADDAVESEHLNNNVISGQTALTSGLATTDELLISDGGTIKRMDVSVLSEQFASADDVTALAIALG